MKMVDRAPATLLTLPGEVKLLIYGFVLTSSTGAVVLELMRCRPFRLRIYEHDGVEKDLDKVINWGILRVCKQTAKDCRGLLWTNNRMIFSEGFMELVRLNTIWIPQEYGGYWITPCAKYLPVPFSRYFELTIPQWRISDGAISEKSWTVAGKIVKQGTLRSLTLEGTITVPWRGAIAASPPLCLASPVFWPPMKEELISSIADRLRALTKLQNATLQTKKLVLDQEEVEPYSPHDSIDGVAERFHEAFGGELWMKKTLCWKDGRQISLPSRVKLS